MQCAAMQKPLQNDGQCTGEDAHVNAHGMVKAMQCKCKCDANADANANALEIQRQHIANAKAS